MSKKKPDKKINLEASFEDVLVCQKESARTLLEIFVEKPENVAQESLGTLAGILEITDESSDSSYIVNYIVSVLRKEYYSKTKRGAIESFEAALNKANLALAKLAEHGNINWLGKINAIILAIERNNIHLSQAGTAKTLLLRNNILTDITEGAQNLENPSPFKTFVDVLSGRLESDDMLIIATQEIFEIFSFEEIKRSALRFSSEDFMRFLKTALSNELERAAVLVTRIQERKIQENKPTISKSSEINAFSQASYAKIYSPPKPKIQQPQLIEKTLDEEEKESLAKEIKRDLEKESGEFVDKKTGHIYIKEDFSDQNKSQLLENIAEISRIKLNGFFKFIFKKIAFLSPNALWYRFFGNREQEIEVHVESNSTNNILSTEKTKEPIFDKEKFKNLAANTYLIIRRIILTIFSLVVFLIKKVFIGIKKLIPNKSDSVMISENISASSKQINIFQKILPRFSKIKNIFSRLDSSQKFYVALVILIIIIIPYFIAKIGNKNEENLVAQEEVVPPTFLLEQDKNVYKIENLNSVFSKDNLLKVINLNGIIFFIDNSGLTNSEDGQFYSFPAEMGKIKIATNMDDLNLIFLIDKNNKILSWSPVSGKFQDNTIEIPEGSSISLAKTYLTYIYLADQNSNQIFRYPRADTGFGEKVNWLKDNLSLESISDLAIGENIFIAENGNILKFLQGKKQDFSLEETATPIFAAKLYTKRDSQNLFVLDSKNSRIIKLDLEGRIVSQYYNSEISSATDFEINEETNTAYFSNGSEVKSFEMK